MARGTKRTLAVGEGVRLAFSDAGSGPAVLLLHGWPVTSLHWRSIVPALVTAGFRAICADLRGQGPSTRGPGPFTKEALASDVVRLVDRLGVARLAVAGHDWGGTVGYLLAADHRARIAALVVEEELLPGLPEEIPEPGRAWYPAWHGPLHRAPGRLAEALVRGREDVYHRAFLRQSAGPMRLAPGVERAYLDAHRSPAAVRAGLGYYRTADADASAVARRAERPLTTPVLTVGGEFGMGVAVGRCLSRVAAEVRHVQVPGAGHYPAEQRPDVVASELVSFVAARLR